MSCPALPAAAPDGSFDMGDALNKIAALQHQYILCAVKDDCLISAEKDAQKKTSVTCKQATDALKQAPINDTTTSTE